MGKFQEYYIKQQVEFPGVIQKHTMLNFSGMIKKKSCGIFRGLGFRH